MRSYLALLDHVLTSGTRKTDRTGTGTISVFAPSLRVDLEAGFPLLTTKKVHFRSVVGELLWMLAGDTNVRTLNAQGITIWDEWADEDGDLGPVYGRQWRAWQGPDGQIVDQIAVLVDGLKTNPDGRRHVVSAWNPSDLPGMALPPCHALFQFYVADGRLSCHLYQRSADLFLGVPFNIASYALLTHIIAKECGLAVGEFVHSFGDAHIYLNHLDQVREQLSREPAPLPTLHIADRPTPPGEPLPVYEIGDFTVSGYAPQAAIRAKVAV